MTRLRFALFFTAILAAAFANADPAKSETAAKPTLYVVGYSHLDTQWCWTYPQVIREFIPNTLHQNFALMDKYPDYVFNWTGSNRYRFMKEYYPADYEKLKQYVARGQWFPAGSSVEEGDVNSPSEESLIRQVMYGNQFFRREFGKASDEYMLPDCFGFPASLPSILAHCGVKGFSTQKLTWGSAVGIPFNVGNWVGPDGHSVVAALNATSYGTQIKDDLTHNEGWLKRMNDDISRSGVGSDYMYYGTGDQGGSPDENSVKNLETSLHGNGQVKVVGGRADQMFNDLTPGEIAKLPSYKGDLELTQHSAGSLSSESAMKRWNRKNELLANAAESTSVAADWLGGAKYDKARITDAWLRFLPGQFHDLMAGTALPEAYTYTWNDEILAMNEFAGVIQNSVGGVSRALDTTGNGTSVVVYNPLSVDRSDVVEAKISLPAGGRPLPTFVYDDHGQRLPTQVIGSDEKSMTVLFVAQVPSLGYKAFSIVSGDANPMVPGNATATTSGLENSRYKVQINGNGDVSSVFDKSIGKELLAAPARLVYQHENPTQYPAWNMDWDDQKLPPSDWVRATPEVKVLENGPVRAALQITRHYKGSKFVQTLMLGSGMSGERLDFKTEIDWQGSQSALKAEFPLTASNPVATYNWGLGTVQRGNNDPKKYEVASHGWIDLTNTDGSYGTSILDDCKYGSDKPYDNILRLTLLYTPGARGNGYQHQTTQDWGHQVMTYSLAGHGGDWVKGGTQWESACLNQPLLAFQTDHHSGSLGKSFSMGSTSTPAVSIEALKQAEDSQEVIVRLNELEGTDHPATAVSFAAPIESAREIDGQERNIGAANVQDGKLVVDVHKYEPRAFAVKLASTATPLKRPTSQTLDLPYTVNGMGNRGSNTADFDGAGHSLPADLMPSTVVSNGIRFQTGPREAKNVVVCQGQSVSLPAGTDRKLWILGASINGDITVPFDFGGTTAQVPLQAWNGFIGAWDTRSWAGKVPEMTWDWFNPIAGLVPGFIKRDPVAWYSDHIHEQSGANEPYQFCYLFRYAVDVPDGATQVTLPKDDRARIVAMTITDDPNGKVSLAQPLYDTMDHPPVDGPSVQVRVDNPNGPQFVTLMHPLYWSATNPLRYTLDGTTPNSQSPAYTRPFALGRSCTVTVAQMDAKGQPVAVTSQAVVVNDTTPPAVTSAMVVPGTLKAKLWFNEELDQASAENPANFQVDGVNVSKAELGGGGRLVTLTLGGNPAANASVHISGVADVGGNTLPSTAPLLPLAPVSYFNDLWSFTGQKGQTKKANVPPLVARADSSWTINMWVYMDQQPEELTLVGGFGNAQDTTGAQRFIINHLNQVGFWGSDIDIYTATPFDIKRWQMVTATYDGSTVKIYKDGTEIGSQQVSFAEAAPTALLAPRPAWEYGHLFKGRIANFTLWSEALPANYIRTNLMAQKPK